MPKRCAVTGKKARSGNRISHSHHATGRRQLANLQARRIWMPAKNAFVKVLVSTRALRTIDCLGADEVFRRLKCGR